jgi:hypothetical protein
MHAQGGIVGVKGGGTCKVPSGTCHSEPTDEYLASFECEQDNDHCLQSADHGDVSRSQIMSEGLRRKAAET